MKEIECLDNYPTRYFVDEEGRVWYNANDCARAIRLGFRLGSHP